MIDETLQCLLEAECPVQSRKGFCIIKTLTILKILKHDFGKESFESRQKNEYSSNLPENLEAQ